MPRRIRVVTAIIQQDHRYLITQRRGTALMPLLWEFPGGKVEEFEEDGPALKRELHERLGIDVVLGHKIGEKSHRYDTHEVTVVLYSATIPPNQELRSRRVNDFRWVLSSDLGRYEFPDADEDLKKYAEEPTSGP